MRSILVVTSGRADYGILRPVIRAIDECPELTLRIAVTGMHLSANYGYTATMIEEDGYTIDFRIESQVDSTSQQGISKSIANGIFGFGQLFSQWKPDILLLLGDRYEILAVAVAALPFVIPIAHIHGGESTEGLIDEPIRHSITKMSHLHFASTAAYRARIIQMGEEPERVYNSGAPSLDQIKDLSLVTWEDLVKELGLKSNDKHLIVTFHPETLDHQNVVSHFNELLSAINEIGIPAIFTCPNSDTNGILIREAINSFVINSSKYSFVENLGTVRYFSLMKSGLAMVGNSSSGIIEAASFNLPVINIGQRQKGRLHSYNVINCDSNKSSIVNAINKAISSKFKDSLIGMQNPYGDGDASKRIISVLKSIKIDRFLTMKSFYNLSNTECNTKSD